MSAILWVLLIAAVLFFIGFVAFILAACQLAGKADDELAEMQAALQQRYAGMPDAPAEDDADPFERIASADSDA